MSSSNFVEDDSIGAVSERGTYVAEGQRSDVYAGQSVTGISLHDLAESLGKDIDGVHNEFNTDTGALLLPSSHAPIAAPARSQAEDNMAFDAAYSGAILHNKTALQVGRIDAVARAALERVLESSKSLPPPSVITHVGNRKVHVSGEIISAARDLNKAASLSLLKKFFGAECKGDKKYKDGTIDKCECPTHNVVRCAQQNGFRDKPILWLSQKFVEQLHQPDLKNAIPLNENKQTFPNEDVEHKLQSVLAQLFTWENVERMAFFAEMRRVSIMHVFNILCDRAVAEAKRITSPETFVSEFDT